MLEVQRLLNTLRKPEVRSSYSDELVCLVKSYLNVIFRQNNPPQFVHDLRESNGLFLIEGSVLRGTADPGYSRDVDVTVMYDSATPADHFWRLYLEFAEGKSFHPYNVSFHNFVANWQDSGVSASEFVDWIQGGDYEFISTAVIKMRNHSLVHPPDFMLGQASSPQVIRQAILAERDFNHFVGFGTITPDLLASLLTTTSSFVYETTPGALPHHQRLFLDALSQLKAKNPSGFNECWAYLEEQFAVMNRNTEWKHPDLDERLLKEYLERSGRFRPDQIEKATHFLKGIRSHLKWPSLEQFQQVYALN